MKMLKDEGKCTCQSKELNTKLDELQKDFETLVIKYNGTMPVVEFLFRLLQECIGMTIASAPNDMAAFELIAVAQQEAIKEVRKFREEGCHER